MCFNYKFIISISIFLVGFSFQASSIEYTEENQSISINSYFYDELNSQNSNSELYSSLEKILDVSESQRENVIITQTDFRIKDKSSLLELNKLVEIENLKKLTGAELFYENKQLKGFKEVPSPISSITFSVKYFIGNSLNQNYIQNNDQIYPKNRDESLRFITHEDSQKDIIFIIMNIYNISEVFDKAFVIFLFENEHNRFTHVKLIQISQFNSMFYYWINSIPFYDFKTKLKSRIYFETQELIKVIAKID